MNDLHHNSPLCARERSLRLQRALSGLSLDEARDLANLAGNRPETTPDSWERAAAAAHLALLGEERSPVPESLRRRLLAGAQAALFPSPPEMHPE